MTKPKKASVTKERTVHTYSELWHASSCVLEKGLCESEASSWQFLSSVILTAFTFEAYLNHTGEKIFSCWNDIERLPPLAKFALLCEELKVDFPQGKRPRSTISELFTFRDSIAHGKSRTIKDSYLRDINDKLYDHLGERLLLDWETKIRTADFAKRVREDVERVLKKLHEARPAPKEYLFTFGMGSHGAKLEFYK
ncbi:MAG: hypothetical protein ACOY15_11915 [Pseudomonadota bacterium]